MKTFKRFDGLTIFEIIDLWTKDKSELNFIDFYIEQIGYDIAYKIDSEAMKKIHEDEYKEGFKAGLDACKPNAKVDKAISEGTKINIEFNADDFEDAP